MLAGCGGRTDLLVGGPRRDASTDVQTEPVMDASVEDAPVEDAPVEDAPEEDSLPPIDATPDVIHPNNCPDGSATLVYVVTEQNQLYSFYPPSGTFKAIGTIHCNDGTATPFSMGVDRQGIARVVFDDGKLFLVNTRNAACSPTPFQPNQDGVETFGMGYVADTTDTGETLYIASDESNTSRLGIIDTTNYTLSIVATMAPNDPFQRAELTGTGSGDLFAFYTRGNSGSAIGQIDRNTGALIAETQLPSVSQGNAWAFAYWGGDFWMFTAPGGAGSTVTRFRPADNSVAVVAHLRTSIVGAGVSTCAPE
jgi:hypothetical protein